MNYLLVIEDILKIFESLSIVLVLAGLIFITVAIIGKFKDWFNISDQQAVRFIAGFIGAILLIVGIWMDSDASKVSQTDSNNVRPSTSSEGVYRARLLWHDVGFTSSDARKLQSLLEEKNVQVEVAKHNITSAPDAVFIGVFIPSEIASLVLKEVPYEIRYIYRPDYPQEYGGDPSGFLVGIGYTSLFDPDPTDPKSVPVEVSQADLNSLSNPDITNTEFQRRLRLITSF